MRIIITLTLASKVLFGFAMSSHLNWDRAVDQAIIRYGLQTEPQLIKFFRQAKVAYPPQDIALLAFKKERYIELWAKDKSLIWHFIHRYPLTASSGRLGPKLKEHDKQIPEGIYRLTSMNPFSSMHLSMMINYPNQFDRQMASLDGRHKLGSNIFLHGRSQSVGCLAVGDRAIDQLFLLVRRVGLLHTQLIISPNDLRQTNPHTLTLGQPKWLPRLYQQIRQALLPFKHSRRAQELL